MAEDMKKIKQGLGLSESEIEAFAEQQRLLNSKPSAGIIELIRWVKGACQKIKKSLEGEPGEEDEPAFPTVYDYRERGREFCRTEGSDHYRRDGIEQMDYIIAQGWADGFCKGNVTKYLTRHDYTGDLEDLKKAADYLHILAGVELGEEP